MTRDDFILPLVSGRVVLDCGGADHNLFSSKLRNGEWLHEEICKVARSVVGIDISAKSVDRLNATGDYNFICADVECLNFIDEFEVVVAGEIIEHVYNPGAMLDSIWKSLKPGGAFGDYHAQCSIYDVLSIRTVFKQGNDAS